MKQDDIYFMKLALKEAEKAFDLGEVPVGAIVIVGGRVIARSHNLTERLNDVTAHAEMQAITSAANFLNGKYLIGCTLYVTLEPCIMCAGAMAWSQLNRLVYGASDPKSGGVEQGPRVFQHSQSHHKPEVYAGIGEQDSQLLIKAFFKTLRR